MPGTTKHCLERIVRIHPAQAGYLLPPKSHDGTFDCCLGLLGMRHLSNCDAETCPAPCPGCLSAGRRATFTFSPADRRPGG